MNAGWAALLVLAAAVACKRSQPAGPTAPDADSASAPVAADEGAPSPVESDVVAVVAQPGNDTVAPEPPSPTEWPSPADAPPAGTACGDMTAAQCLLSAGCVLEAVRQADTEYVCREAKAPCEGGVAQFPPLPFKADCEARDGCHYLAADCFCPTAQTRVRATSSVGISCACGGGPPHRCVEDAIEM